MSTDFASRLGSIGETTVQNATTFVATLMISVQELLDIVAFMKTLPGDTAK